MTGSPLPRLQLPLEHTVLWRLHFVNAYVYVSDVFRWCARIRKSWFITFSIRAKISRSCSWKQQVLQEPDPSPSVAPYPRAEEDTHIWALGDAGGGAVCPEHFRAGSLIKWNPKMHWTNDSLTVCLGLGCLWRVCFCGCLVATFFSFVICTFCIFLL